jgi:surface antigen
VQNRLCIDYKGPLCYYHNIMISETRTKITSWLRSPKSLAAKISIGATVVLAVSVPAVSAMVLNNEPKTAQNSVISAENTQEAADLEQNTPTNSTTPAETSTNDATAPANNTTGGSTGQNTQQTTPETTPAAPAAPVYSDSYPSDWKNQCDQLDTWGLNKCQSTSYAAWKVSEAGLNMPKYWGDASTWPAKADTQNIPRGSTPKLHSVGVVGNFNAFVEAVNGDMITVSWYNWGNTKQYGTWENIPASKFSTYIYF